MELLSFTDDFTLPQPDEPTTIYTHKIETPVYTPKGKCPHIKELVDATKTKQLMREIDCAEGLTDDERAFLKYASMRHCAFNYEAIAEYYCHATPEMQRLMEDSALVIIDFDSAIEKGFVQLSKDIIDITRKARKERGMDK